MSDLAIEAINLEEGMAVLTNGVVVPITRMFGYSGEYTTDPNEAVTFVAGAGRVWLVGVCKDYQVSSSN